MVASTPQPAAITGMGIISCIGTDLSTVSRSLEQGRSGIVFNKERSALGFKSPLTARLPKISPKAE
ncbi:MAG: hypothetical protein U9P10_03745, partial [Thermodesulfobacteriota bacterium]|nr:hypothetical protein [Thermodesulfobacteriota bacterium]